MEYWHPVTSWCFRHERMQDITYPTAEVHKQALLSSIPSTELFKPSCQDSLCIIEGLLPRWLMPKDPGMTALPLVCNQDSVKRHFSEARARQDNMYLWIYTPCLKIADTQAIHWSIFHRWWLFKELRIDVARMEDQTWWCMQKRRKALLYFSKRNHWLCLSRWLH